MYKVSETVLPIYINGQCPIIKTCSDVTLNLSRKDSSTIVTIINHTTSHITAQIDNDAQQIRPDTSIIKF